MTSTEPGVAAGRLPIKNDLTLIYGASLGVALLMAGGSVAGLLFSSNVYPTEELKQTFVANDVTNLLIGLPLLLGSMGLARQGRLMGLLFWPGALLFVIYNAIAYLFALPLDWAFVLQLALLPLAIYVLVGLMASIDGAVVQGQLAGRVPERLAGAVLMGMSALFLALQIGTLAGPLAGRDALPHTELAVIVGDTMIMPAWLIGGVLLWRRKALGYVAGAGLLFQASMLFVGVASFLLLQPVLTDAPFAPVDVAVILVLGLISFIPFGLYVRGLRQAQVARR